MLNHLMTAVFQCLIYVPGGRGGRKSEVAARWTFSPPPVLHLVLESFPSSRFKRNETQGKLNCRSYKGTGPETSSRPQNLHSLRLCLSDPVLGSLGLAVTSSFAITLAGRSRTQESPCLLGRSACSLAKYLRSVSQCRRPHL